MKPLGFSEEAIQAIVDTYRFFDVCLSDSFSCGPRFYVFGYKGLLRRFFRIGDDLCYFRDVDDAWVLVSILRNCREGQSLEQQLQRLGISCPVPVSVIRKDGDSHG